MTGEADISALHSLAQTYQKSVLVHTYSHLSFRVQPECYFLREAFDL